VEHINKNNKLACGCETPLQDSLYLYRKQYGLGGISLKVFSENYKLKFLFDGEYPLEFALRSFVLWCILNTPNNADLIANYNLVQYAVKEAFTGSTTYLMGYGARCVNCQSFLGFSFKKKCSIHDWCQITCKDFQLKDKLKETITAPITFDEQHNQKWVLDALLQKMGCYIDDLTEFGRGRIYNYVSHPTSKD